MTELGCGWRMGREHGYCCDSCRCFTQHPMHGVIPHLCSQRGLLGGMNNCWSREKGIQWGWSGKGWRHHSLCWRFSPRDAPQRGSRLQAPGDGLAWALQSSVSRGPVGWGSLGRRAQEQKSPCGIPVGCATCPRSSKEGCGSGLLLVTPLRAGPEPSLEVGGEPHRGWILKATLKFKSGCNLNRNLLFAAS